MSETKNNFALGIGTAALVVAGSSFVYTNSQVNPLLERIETLEADLTNIAINLHELRSVYTTEMSRTKDKVRAVERKVDKFGKRIGHHSELYEEISEIKEEISAILEYFRANPTSSEVELPTLHIPVKKPVKEKKKRRGKKKESSESSDEDSGQLNDYISSLKNK